MGIEIDAQMGVSYSSCNIYNLNKEAQMFLRAMPAHALCYAGGYLTLGNWGCSR